MPKRYLTGGGKDLKNQTKSYVYPSEILKNLKCSAEKLARFLTPKREGESSRGAILIEFAICMPILIILLFYIHDLVKIKRYYSQTEFVGQQMANILQNIAKTREIKLKDIKHAAALSYLTIYPGTTMYTTVVGSDNHILGHQPRVLVYCVRGKPDGRASVVWSVYFRPKTATSPSEWIRSYPSSSRDCGYVRRETDVPPSSIYPTLKVEPERLKIILEPQIMCFEKDQPRKAFGLYLVSPRGFDNEAYFSSVVIFTPNNGFTEKMSQ